MSLVVQRLQTGLVSEVVHRLIEVSRHPIQSEDSPVQMHRRNDTSTLQICNPFHRRRPVRFQFKQTVALVHCVNELAISLVDVR